MTITSTWHGMAWHGKTFDEHVALRDGAARNNYRFLSLSIEGTSATELHGGNDQTDHRRGTARLGLTASELKTFVEQAKQGFGPVILCATGTAGVPRLAAVFQMQPPVALTRHGL